MEIYERRVETDAVLEMRDRCAECKVEMTPTGVLYKHKPPLSIWFVEYHCPNCDGIFRINNSEHAAQLASVLSRAGLDEPDDTETVS